MTLSVCVCVWVCVCVCVCVFNVLVWATRSIATSWNQVHGTWEQNHNDQVIIYECTVLSTVVKQIIFEDGYHLLVWSIACSMKLFPSLSYTSRFTAVRIIKFKLTAADVLWLKEFN